MIVLVRAIRRLVGLPGNLELLPHSVLRNLFEEDRMGGEGSPMTRPGRKRNSDSFDSSLNRGNALPKSTIEMDFPSESKSFSLGSDRELRVSTNEPQWIEHHPFPGR